VTVHITNIFGSTGESETQGICEACAAHSGDVQALRDRGACDYCGAPAIWVFTAFEIPGVMEEETHRRCKQCHSDLAEFAARPENKVPDIDVEDEAALDSAHRQRLVIQQRREAFIRQRVKERRR
jgi:hypothetical protein